MLIAAAARVLEKDQVGAVPSVRQEVRPCGDRGVIAIVRHLSCGHCCGIMAALRCCACVMHHGEAIQVFTRKTHAAFGCKVRGEASLLVDVHQQKGRQIPEFTLPSSANFATGLALPIRKSSFP